MIQGAPVPRQYHPLSYNTCAYVLYREQKIKVPKTVSARRISDTWVQAEEIRSSVVDSLTKTGQKWPCLITSNKNIDFLSVIKKVDKTAKIDRISWSVRDGTKLSQKGHVLSLCRIGKSFYFDRISNRSKVTGCTDEQRPNGAFWWKILL